MASCNNPGAARVFGHPMPAALGELRQYQGEIERGLVTVKYQYRSAANGPLKNGSMQIQRGVAEGVKAALDEIASNPSVAFNFGGSYNFRGMNNGKSNPPASIHSLGLAFDVNVPQNPYAHDPRGDSALHMRSMNHPIVRAFTSRGWTWGGSWSRPDYMHFEFSGNGGAVGGGSGFDGAALGSTSLIGNGGMTLGEITGEALAAKCPDDIEFKGMWSRYHLQAGTRSPIIQSFMVSVPGSYMGIGGGNIGEFIGGGKYPVPPGFPNDNALAMFISNAEGHVTLKWSPTKDGQPVANSKCPGFDLCGGVHSTSIMTAAFGNLEAAFRESLGGRSVNEVQWRHCRAAQQAEAGGHGWTAYLQRDCGPYDSDIRPSQKYWEMLIPYYRDQMIDAWMNCPGIQRTADLAEKMALCHCMNWWGYKRWKGRKDNGQAGAGYIAMWGADGTKTFNHDLDVWRKVLNGGAGLWQI